MNKYVESTEPHMTTVVYWRMETPLNTQNRDIHVTGNSLSLSEEGVLYSSGSA